MGHASQLPDDVLMQILCYEVAHRKWRLVNRKFSMCVSLRVVVNTQLNPKQEERILRMLGYQNCRSLKTNDWCFNPMKIAHLLSQSRSIRSVAIQHCNPDSMGLQEMIISSLNEDVIESWKFGKIDFDDEVLVTLAEVVRKSRSLKVLEFDCCNLGAEGFAFLGEAIPQAKCLRTLAFKSCKLGPKEVECLANGVAQSQSLRELNLAFTPLGHHASQWVGMCIKEAPGLQDINLDFTNVGASMRPLVEGVSGSKTLTQLSLKGNQLGDAGTEALASAITKSSIRSVSLYDNNIQQTGAEALGLAICMAPQLQELQLGSNNVGPQGCYFLAEGIKRSSTFHTLGLVCNGVGAEGASSLAEALTVSNSLSSLDLSYNHVGLEVGLEGAKALARGMRRSKSLVHLDLGSNNLNAEAVGELAGALKDSNIQTLSLACNDMEYAGVHALSEAIAALPSLHTLNLKYVLMGENTVKSLAHGLGKSSIRHLELQGCCIPTAGIQALAEGVAEARRLETLNLVRNSVSEDGAKALAAGITKSASFESLKVHYGELGPAGSQALMAAMQESATFINLQLGSTDVSALHPEMEKANGHHHSPPASPGVTIQPDAENKVIEVHHWRPFTCSRCKHLLYTHDERNRIIIFCVDQQGVIQQWRHGQGILSVIPDRQHRRIGDCASFLQETTARRGINNNVCHLFLPMVMTPEEWHRSAQVEGSVSSDSSTIQGQALTQFMEHRLAGFYHTLCNLIWGGDMCHTQFQWYCDDPDNRREMLTFIYRNNDLIMFSNVTVAETPHQVPGSPCISPGALVPRCPFCGWSCCNGGDWMEPEEFYIWLLTEWPALMRDHDFYPVVCDECLREWVTRYDNPDLHEAIRNLGPTNPAEAVAAPP